LELDSHDILLAEGCRARAIWTSQPTAFINGGAFVEAYRTSGPSIGPNLRAGR